MSHVKMTCVDIPDRFLISVGGRPKMLDVLGTEYCINSDDIFSLKTPPGKT